MAGKTRPLVLVPGACLGGWAWKDVAERLRSGGHEVYPVTLTGLGDRAHLATRGRCRDPRYRRSERAQLRGARGRGARRPQLLRRRRGRRRGPAAGAAERFRLPRHGTFARRDVDRRRTAPELRDHQQRDADERGDGWMWPVPDRATTESGIFGSAAGLRDEHFRLLEERGTPQPYATLTSPVRTVRDVAGDVRRIAILCTASGMNVETVRGLIADGDPRVGVFAAPDWELRELATGHWAMWSAPEELTGLLHEIATA